MCRFCIFDFIEYANALYFITLCAQIFLFITKHFNFQINTYNTESTVAKNVIIKRDTPDLLLNGVKYDISFYIKYQRRTFTRAYSKNLLIDTGFGLCIYIICTYYFRWFYRTKKLHRNFFWHTTGSSI